MDYKSDVQRGSLQVQIFSDALVSFHPKVYLFHTSDTANAVGFVGSSNLSASGIAHSIEWSIGTSDVAPLIESFNALWANQASLPLSHDFLRTYRNQWRTALSTVREVEVAAEPELEPATPIPIQAEP